MYSLRGVLMVCVLVCATMAEEEKKETKCDLYSLCGIPWKIAAYLKCDESYSNYLTCNCIQIPYYCPGIELYQEDGKYCMKLTAYGCYGEKISNIVKSTGNTNCEYETAFWNICNECCLSPSLSVIGTDAKNWAVVCCVKPPNVRRDVWLLTSDTCHDLCEYYEEILKALCKCGVCLQDLVPAPGVCPKCCDLCCKHCCNHCAKKPCCCPVILPAYAPYVCSGQACCQRSCCQRSCCQTPCCQTPCCQTPCCQTPCCQTPCCQTPCYQGYSCKVPCSPVPQCLYSRNLPAKLSATAAHYYSGPNVCGYAIPAVYKGSYPCIY